MTYCTAEDCHRRYIVPLLPINKSSRFPAIRGMSCRRGCPPQIASWQQRPGSRACSHARHRPSPCTARMPRRSSSCLHSPQKLPTASVPAIAACACGTNGAQCGGITGVARVVAKVVSVAALGHVVPASTNIKSDSQGCWAAAASASAARCMPSIKLYATCRAPFVTFQVVRVLPKATRPHCTSKLSSRARGPPSS